MSVFRIYLARRADLHGGIEPSVAVAFQAGCELFCELTGDEPDGCRMSLDMAQRAAREDTPTEGALGMFQRWHPTIEFTIDMTAPPNTLLIYGSVTDEGEPDPPYDWNKPDGEDEEPREPWASPPWRPS